MNKFILFIFCALLCSEAHAQTVGISSSAFTPNSASILDVSSSTKGVLLPRMTTAERGTYTATSSLGATHKGITIFNTTTSRYDYWDGTQWLQLAAVGASGSDFIQNQVAASQTADFRISGKGIFGNGTAVAPSVTFEGSQTTGLYRSAADVLSISTAGGERVRVGSTGVVRLTNYASGMLGVDASGDVQTRSIAVSASGIDVTNGNGVSGNPTLNLNYANSSTGGPYPQGNFGQFVPSASNPTDFNTTPGYWGWNFVAGTTNAPNATSSQWYRGVFALGSEYPARGANSYSLELAYPRYSGATAGVWMRTVENGAIGSWIRIDAGSNNTNFIWNQNASAQTTGNFWVSGTGRTNGTLTGGGSTVISADNIQVNDLGAGSRFAYIDLEGDDTYTDYGLRLIRGNGGVNATSTLTHRGTGDLQIHTNEAAALTFHTTNAERMRIQAGGNVGVNSNAPSNRLYTNDVAATMATTNTYQFGIGLSGTTNMTLGSDASFGLMQTWASKPLLINSQGNNVGIGMTTAPTARLDVTHAVADRVVRIRNTNNAASSNGILVSTTRTASDAYILNLDANGTSRMIALSDGNVGIGTTTPASVLHIITTQTGNVSKLHNTGLGAGSLVGYEFGKANSNFNMAEFRYNHVADGSTSNYVSLGLWSQASTLNVVGTGNVGISTATPGYKLDVNGGIRSIDYGAAGAVNVMVGDDAYFTDIDVGSIMGLYSSSNNAVGGLRFGNTGGAYLYGASNNIGIGNTAPAQKLDVTGNARINNAFEGDVGHGATWAGWANYSQANTTGYSVLASSDGGYTLINKQSTAGYIGFRVANADVAVITNTGNLGVGTTAPGYSRLYSYQSQLTANGDGQASIWAYRTRDSQNDGTGYGIYTTNTGMTGFTYWGDVYTFGVHGATYGDYTRTGGVLGSGGGTSGWGSLGYKGSNSVYYGVYGSNGYASGGGFLPTTKSLGIGGGFAGGVIGSWSMGEVMGSINTGELFASYNLGNEYTSGFSAEIVEVEGKRVAAYSVTSTDVKVYADGTGVLSAESVFVAFDGDFAQLLGSKPTVTVSALGSPATLYVQSVGKDGFTVASAGGPVSTEFMWIAVGRRTDAGSKPSLPADIADKKFDDNLKGVMFNENNKEQSATPVWWDGSRIRFDAAPEEKRKKEPEHDPNKGRAKM